MAYYKLVSQNRSDSTTDEVIFKSGDENKSVSVNVASELTDEDVSVVRSLGYEVAEVPAPEGDENEQVVGYDVAGMSPVVGEQANTGQPAISQVGMERIQEQSAPDEENDELS